MKATEQLKKEHETFIQMLHILDAIKGKLRAGENVDPADLEAIVDFLRTYVDKCHHGKEEILLFPKLVEAGIPNEGGPVGVMLADHVQGRGYIKGFADGIEGYRTGDTEARNQIIFNIENYINLLQFHIHKENNILFGMADMHLEEADQEELLRRFNILEEEVIGKEKREAYHRLLARLSSVYLIGG